MIGTIILLIVLAFAAAAVYFTLRALSADNLREFLQTETMVRTGRELSIDGDLRVRIFSLRPSVQVEDVRLANATWGSQREMVRIKRLDAEIDLLALITGTIQIDRFNLLQPVVLIETDRQGRGNWLFEPRRSTPATAASRLTTLPFALDVREVRVVDGRLMTRNGVTGRVRQFDLTRLNIHSRSAAAPLAIDLAGTVNDRPFTLAGSVGSLTDLATRQQPLPVELTVGMGDSRASLTGTVAKPLELAGIDVRLAAEGDELADVLRYFDVNAPALGRYRLSGQLSGSTSSFAARNIVLAVNDGRVTLTGAVAQLPELTGIDVRVAAEGDELAEVLRYFDVNTPDLGRYRLSGRLSGSARSLAARDVKLVVGDPERTGARLQGGIRDVLGLAGADFDVSARIADPQDLGNVAWLKARKLPPLALQGRVTQSREGYAAQNLVLRLGQSSLSGTVTVTPRTPRWKITVRLTGPLIDLHELAQHPVSGAESATPATSPPGEGGKLFSAEPLSAGWLNSVDLDLKLQAGRLVLKVVPDVSAVSAHVVLKDGKFSVDPLRMKLSPDGNPLAIRLRARATPAGKFDLNASTRGNGIGFEHLSALVGKTTGISGAPTDVTLDLQATGDSVRELMAGLNGEVRLVVGAGQLNERVYDTGADLLSRFFLMAYPFAKEKSYTPIECAVVRLPVRDGVVTVNRSMAIETKKVSIAVSGIIDLRNETIDLYSHTQAREGLGLGTGKLTNMYRIQGPLGSPSVGLGTKGVMESGVSTGAAVGTAGLSLLVERLMINDRHPCRTALGSPPESN